MAQIPTRAPFPLGFGITRQSCSISTNPQVPLGGRLSCIHEFRVQTLTAPSPSERLVADTDSDQRSRQFLGRFPE